MGTIDQLEGPTEVLQDINQIAGLKNFMDGETASHSLFPADFRLNCQCESQAATAQLGRRPAN